mgnify:FL=1
MKQSSKRLLSSVVALFFLVGAFLVFFNLIQPAYAELQRLRGEIQSRNTFVNEQRAVIEQVKKLVAVYKGGAEVHEAVSFALPLKADIATAIGQLNGLLRASNLKPLGFTASFSDASPATGPAGKTPLSGVPVQPTGMITFKLRFSGPYANFKSFLGDLETNVRIMDVTAITFQPAEKPNKDDYAYDLTVVTYYQKNK